ncbi:hypothetical protein BDF14DRAFT_1763062 [Spinellus fusiger]|nr:hypothetical protein BDF14DRAFT_1763062 [Spinellus fusiger]
MSIEHHVHDLQITCKETGVGNHYERKRQHTIEENQRILQALGLTHIAPVEKPLSLPLSQPQPQTQPLPQPLPMLLSIPARKKTKYTKQNHAKIPPASPTTGRLSRRLRGQAPEAVPELEDILDLQDRWVSTNTVVPDQREQVTAHKAIASGHMSIPLTLVSISTTIWELGELSTGRGRSKYWSGRGCRYRHPYPIGFRASKSHFGNHYTMTIEKGEEGDGPVFTVQVNGTGTVYKGASPTAPWTEACKHSNSQGTRVSGPLVRPSIRTRSLIN